MSRKGSGKMIVHPNPVRINTKMLPLLEGHPLPMPTMFGRQQCKRVHELSCSQTVTDWQTNKLSSLVPDDFSEPSILRCRSCGVEQFAAGHSYCINTLYFQKSAHDSSVFAFVSIINLISSSVGLCCTAPLWWLYGHVTAPYKLSYY